MIWKTQWLIPYLLVCKTSRFGNLQKDIQIKELKDENVEVKKSLKTFHAVIRLPQLCALYQKEERKKI